MDIDLPTILHLLIVLFILTACVLGVFQLGFLFRFKRLQRRYSRAILATNAGVWEWFPKTGRWYASPEFFQQLGFKEETTPKSLDDLLILMSTKDQIKFKQWQSALLGPRQDTVPKSIRFTLSNTSLDTQTATSYKNDQEEGANLNHYCLEMRGNVVRRDGRQRAHSVAGILEEISHLVATENALISAREEARRRELTLSILLDNIPDVVWSKDEQGRYLDCNKAFLDFNGFSIGEITGKNDQDLNLDGKGGYYQQRDQEAMQTGLTIYEQSWGQPKNGGEPRLFDVCRVPITGESSLFRGTLGVARDITERHLLINQLKLFKSFADNSAQGFAMATLDGEISYFNETIRSLLGVPEEANDAFLAELNHLEFYTEPTQRFLQETVIPYVKEKGVWQGELEAKSLDGRVFPTHETYFLLRDEEGKPISFGDVMNDISDQKHVSMQLEQAKEAAEQANQAKSQFLANMSHEIRTPLNAIIGYAQLIGEDNQLVGVSRTRFLSIASAGERLLALINDILDIARIESGRLVLHEQKMNLCREVNQIGRLFLGQAQSKGLDLMVECDLDEDLLVWMDPVKFQQILTNLLGNAVKFTIKGYVKIVARIEAERIQIVIEDTGPGIESALMEHLFTPFVQGKAGEASGGTGLGLALSTTLVKLMQGALSVTSSEGEGTQIKVDLPLSRVNQNDAAEFHEQDAFLNMRLNDPIRVLVAEDDDWSRDILVSLLEKAGCQIIEAQDGEQAINAFRANPPDLVMTDIRMPNKSGIDLLQVIKQENPERSIPVIAITASTLVHEQQELLDQGFWQVIAKPYQIEAIYKALVAHLDVHFVPLYDAKLNLDDEEKSLLSAHEEATNQSSADTLRPLTSADWQPLLAAAQSGDMQTTEDVFYSLREALPKTQEKALKSAIDQFDLGLVETLIEQFQTS